MLELQERLNWEVQLRKKIDIYGNDNDNEDGGTIMVMKYHTKWC